MPLAPSGLSIFSSLPGELESLIPACSSNKTELYLVMDPAAQFYKIKQGTRRIATRP